METRLFAVYLGGRAPRCNTELHDVVFATGGSIEATYEKLMDRWFGDPLSVHIDSWLQLDAVDGYRIRLDRKPPTHRERLFFINLGGYQPGQFTEQHASAFFVGHDDALVKQRAKRELLSGADSVHEDDLLDIDDCLNIDQVDGWNVHLEHVGQTAPLAPTTGYHVIPKSIVQAYAASRGIGQ